MPIGPCPELVIINRRLQPWRWRVECWLFSLGMRLVQGSPEPPLLSVLYALSPVHRHAPAFAFTITFEVGNVAFEGLLQYSRSQTARRLPRPWFVPLIQLLLDRTTSPKRVPSPWPSPDVELNPSVLCSVSHPKLYQTTGRFAVPLAKGSGRGRLAPVAKSVENSRQ